MSIKNKILFPFIIFMSIAYFFTEYYNFNHSLTLKIDEIYNLNEKNLYTLLELEQDSIKAVAIDVANNEIVKEAYIKNEPQIIQDYYKDFWQKLKEENLLYEMHFFKKPAISFVNFSNFNSIGNDVSDVRSDMVWVASSFAESTHVLMCKTFAGIRATYPIIDKKNGVMLGGVSLGKKIDLLPATYKKLTGNDAILVYRHDATKTLIKKYYDDFMSDKIKVGNYVISNATLKIEPSKVVKFGFGDGKKVVQVDDKKYLLNIFSIMDFNHNIMSYMFVLNDLSYFYTNFYDKIIKDIFIILLIGSIVYFAINHNINLVLSKIASLSALSKKLQNKNFNVLDEVTRDSHESRDEIVLLQSDILLMGDALREYYDNLQGMIDEKTAQIKKQLYIDELTSLANRKALQEDLSKYKGEMLVFLDIDNFSNINDFYGVEVGNFVLISLAKKLKYDEDIKVYRVGSDEFALLSTSKDGIFTKIHELIKFLSTIKFIYDKFDLQINVDLTIGITYDEDVSIERADMALFKAKKEHLHYYIYDDTLALKDEQLKNLVLAKKIKEAIANDKFLLYYQPIFDKNEKILKYEALIRLDDGKEILTPYHFLEYAKKSKYYYEITKIVIDKSFEKFKDIDVLFSVNLSVDDIINQEVTSYIYDKLKKFHKPQNVIFEILEDQQILNIALVKEFIATIKNYGARIAIDDFGSGYSNFAYLLNIKPDFIKIDGSLVKAMIKDDNSLLLVRSIVEFAKVSNIKVVAEFVENEEIFEKAKEYGIDEFQGFYFSMPLKNIL